MPSSSSSRQSRPLTNRRSSSIDFKRDRTNWGPKSKREQPPKSPFSRNSSEEVGPSKARSRNRKVILPSNSDDGHEPPFPPGTDSQKDWPVIAILKENNTQYLIQWDGVDEFGEPWKPSWEPKSVASRELVEAWEQSKPLRRQRPSRISTRSSVEESRSPSVRRNSPRLKRKTISESTEEKHTSESDLDHRPNKRLRDVPSEASTSDFAHDVRMDLTPEKPTGPHKQAVIEVLSRSATPQSDSNCLKVRKGSLSDIEPPVPRLPSPQAASSTRSPQRSRAPDQNAPSPFSSSRKSPISSASGIVNDADLANFSNTSSKGSLEKLREKVIPETQSSDLASVVAPNTAIELPRNKLLRPEELANKELSRPEAKSPTTQPSPIKKNAARKEAEATQSLAVAKLPSSKLNQRFQKLIHTIPGNNSALEQTPNGRALFDACLSPSSISLPGVVALDAEDLDHRQSESQDFVKEVEPSDQNRPLLHPISDFQPEPPSACEVDDNIPPKESGPPKPTSIKERLQTSDAMSPLSSRPIFKSKRIQQGLPTCPVVEPSPQRPDGIPSDEMARTVAKFNDRLDPSGIVFLIDYIKKCDICPLDRAMLVSFLSDPKAYLAQPDNRIQQTRKEFGDQFGFELMPTSDGSMCLWIEFDDLNHHNHVVTWESSRTLQRLQDNLVTYYDEDSQRSRSTRLATPAPLPTIEDENSMSKSDCRSEDSRRPLNVGNGINLTKSPQREQIGSVNRSPITIDKEAALETETYPTTDENRESRKLGLDSDFFSSLKPDQPTSTTYHQTVTIDAKEATSSTSVDASRPDISTGGPTDAVDQQSPTRVQELTTSGLSPDDTCSDSKEVDDAYQPRPSRIKGKRQTILSDDFAATSEDESVTSTIPDFESDSPEELRAHIKELMSSIKTLRLVLNGALDFEVQSQTVAEEIHARELAEKKVQELVERLAEQEKLSKKWETKFHAKDVEVTGLGARLLDMMAQNDAVSKENRELRNRLRDANHPAQSVYNAFSAKMKEDLTQLETEAHVYKQTIARLQVRVQELLASNNKRLCSSGRNSPVESRNGLTTSALEAENESLRQQLVLLTQSEAEARSGEAIQRQRAEQLETASRIPSPGSHTHDEQLPLLDREPNQASLPVQGSQSSLLHRDNSPARHSDLQVDITRADKSVSGGSGFQPRNNHELLPQTGSLRVKSPPKKLDEYLSQYTLLAEDQFDAEPATQLERFNLDDLINLPAPPLDSSYKSPSSFSSSPFHQNHEMSKGIARLSSPRPNNCQNPQHLRPSDTLASQRSGPAYEPLASHALGQLTDLIPVPNSSSTPDHSNGQTKLPVVRMELGTINERGTMW
ncbi:hypothetical protein CROQUDRAFT_150926 [Cronartium quercuum f. sp. fusiforme G11]|uniref:Chromo domain-containing protein n=1 Tax=Cronartium quercuum f. sp. fusiforme G11 TaxID=708437 RepID=A0A9P6NZZ7_9BASI|nr:hypothetical protein CROQUDRAFT_150926 [Cronartium quercuum f. sp. fusiforme G11]